MTKGEAICELYGLIADINEEEVADHIKSGVSLQDWTNAWRCRAKDVLRVLEDTADTPQTDCPYDEDDKCFGCGDDTKCVVFDTPQTEPSEEEIREAIIDGCKRSAKFSKVISTSQTEQTDCDTCKYAQIADEHCEFCGEAYIDNYEPQTESYYTDATHFGKAKGESTTTNTADTPQTEDEIVLDPSFAELSDEQFVKAMKLIEPQTDCGWK